MLTDVLCTRTALCGKLRFVSDAVCCRPPPPAACRDATGGRTTAGTGCYNSAACLEWRTDALSSRRQRVWMLVPTATASMPCGHGVSSRTSDELRLPFEKTFPSHCAWESKLYFCVICVQFRPPCKVFANFFKTLKKNRKKGAGY